MASAVLGDMVALGRPRPLGLCDAGREQQVGPSQGAFGGLGDGPMGSTV